MTRNPGIPLDIGFIEQVRVDPDRAMKQAEELGSGQPTHAMPSQLIEIVRCLDLTALSPAVDAERVRALCRRATHPLHGVVSRSLGRAIEGLRVGAVCVCHRFARTAANALRGSGVPVAAVAGGFPTCLEDHAARLAEIRRATRDGAAEIDSVIDRGHVWSQRWGALYEEIASIREACGAARLKMILAAGDLGSLQAVAQASYVAMMAGADFIKTSTGREAVNATLPIGLVMATAIRSYHEQTGNAVGLKPAGGIRAASDAIDWLRLVERTLGNAWCSPQLFRIGASHLLDNIVHTFERGVDHE